MNSFKYNLKVTVPVMLLFAIISSGCGLLGNSDAAAQTVTAAFNNLTETAKAAPTNTPVPPPPTIPPPPVVQPTAAEQAPAQPVVPPSTAPILTALDNTNCRMGADPIYPITGAFIKNMQSKIIGTNDSQTWWLIEDPSQQGQNCWVWGQTTQISGDTSTVPFIPSPALPADIPLPYPTEEEPPL